METKASVPVDNEEDSVPKTTRPQGRSVYLLYLVLSTIYCFNCAEFCFALLSDTREERGGSLSRNIP